MATAVALVLGLVTDAGLQRVLASQPDGGLVTLGQDGIQSDIAYHNLQRQSEKATASRVPGLLRRRWGAVSTTDLDPASVNAKSVHVAPFPRVVYREGLSDRIAFLSGELPTADRAGDTFLATASEQAAQNLGLHQNDIYCVAGFAFPEENVCLRIAGIWKPRAPRDPFWFDADQLARGVNLGEAGIFDILATLAHSGTQATIVYAPDPRGLVGADLGAVLTGLGQLRGDFSVRRDNAFLKTGLDAAIRDFRDRLRVAAFAIELVAAQVLLLALLYLILVAGHVLGQQRHTFALWRSRGWSWRRIWLLLMIEFVLVALVAVPAGAALAWLAVLLIGRAVFGSAVGPASERFLAESWPFVTGALLAGLGILAVQALLAALSPLLEVRRRRSRTARPWWQWRYLDLGLALLAVPLLAQTRLVGRGAVRASGVSGTDPFTLVLPGLALAFLALAAVRLLPLLGPLAALLGRGAAGWLAAREIGRRPSEHAWLALLVMTTVALGVFGATDLATQAHNAGDRAAYAAGADFRAYYDTQLPPLDRVQGQLEGVTAATQVFRTAGTTSVDAVQPAVLGVDPVSFGQTAWTRSDLAARPLPDLLRLLVTQETGGYLLPGRPDSIGLWVYSTGLDTEFTIILTDANGRWGFSRLGALSQPGWRYLEAPFSFDRGSPAYPLRLRRLELQTPPDSRDGRLAIAGLGVRTGSGDPSLLQSFQDPVGWWWLQGGSSALPSDLKATSLIPHDKDPTVSWRIFPGESLIVIRPPLSTRDTVPALASQSTLDRLGIQVGDPMLFQARSATVPLNIVGVVDHFPSLYPERGDFLVASREPLLAFLGRGGYTYPWPNELWVDVRDSAAKTDQARLQGSEPYDLFDRRRLQSGFDSDPIWLGLKASLLVTFLTALALGAVAFGFHFLAAGQARLDDYAILQGNGMPRSAVLAVIRLERWLVLGFGVLLGCAFGLLLAAVVLPVLELGTGPLETVPATILILDPGLILGALAATTAAASLAGMVGSWTGGRFNLLQQLRMLG